MPENTKIPTGSIPLPTHVLALMWEYKNTVIRWPEDSDLVIRKILDAGGWDSIQWLIDTAAHEVLRTWIAQRQGAGLEPRKIRFWQAILDIPASQADEWVKAAKADPWGGRLAH